MALGITEINAILQEEAPMAFADAVTRYGLLFNSIRQVGPSDPQGPRWQVKTTGESSAATYSEFGAFPTGSQFTPTQAQLGWGRYVATLEISQQSLDQLAAGQTFIANYINEQYAEKIKSLVATMDGHIRGGDNTNGITGLTSIIDDDNTYAGIVRGSVTAFQAYINDNSGSGRALTMALLDDVHNNLVQVNGGNYTHILCDYNQLDKYTALTSGNGVPAVHRNTTDGMSATFAGGYVGAFYRGRPVVAIPGYTSGRMDFIEWDALALELLHGFRQGPERRANDVLYFDWTIKPQLRLHNPKMQCAGLIDLN